MKQTIKTSRVAGQLEKMFRALNSRFFGGELPEVVISLKKTAGAYTQHSGNASNRTYHPRSIYRHDLSRPQRIG